MMTTAIAATPPPPHPLSPVTAAAALKNPIKQSHSIKPKRGTKRKATEAPRSIVILNLSSLLDKKIIPYCDTQTLACIAPTCRKYRWLVAERYTAEPLRHRQIEDSCGYLTTSARVGDVCKSQEGVDRAHLGTFYFVTTRWKNNEYSFQHIRINTSDFLKMKTLEDVKQIIESDDTLKESFKLAYDKSHRLTLMGSLAHAADSTLPNSKYYHDDVVLTKLYDLSTLDGFKQYIMDHRSVRKSKRCENRKLKPSPHC